MNSRIDKLIKELCPEGVEKVRLGDVGSFYNGVTGKSKKDFEDGNAKFITYMNIFSNPTLKIDVSDKVVIKEGEKQNMIKYGDCLFTTSSETPEECGMSSVLTLGTEEPLYLNTFCFGYRFNDLSGVEPSFMSHLFRSEEMRAKISKTANGVTRFNVSKKLFEKIEIPLPPLTIQQEIVNILDKFTSLIDKIDEEIELRQKQYEYYREKLLTFEDGEVKWKKLGDCCNVQAGGTPSRKNESYWNNGTIKWLGSTVCQNVSKIDDVTDYITEEGYNHSSARLMHYGTTLVALVGATIGKTAYLTFDATINQNIAGIYPQDTINLLNKYIYYYSNKWYNSFTKLGDGKMAMANMSFVRALEIPIPSPDRQQSIVSTLDKFETLISKLKEERSLRQKQYEFYREKLLTFS